jgi:hypothetical protein
MVVDNSTIAILENELKQDKNYFRILDYILYGPREGAFLYFTVIDAPSATKIVENLVKNGVVNRTERPDIYQVNPNLSDGVERVMKPFYDGMLKEVRTSIESLNKEDLPTIIQMFSELQFREERYYNVIDVCNDQYFDQAVLKKWEMFTKNGIAFCFAFSSKKHTYHHYEFRREPFDAFRMLLDALAPAILREIQTLGDCGFFILYLMQMNKSCGRKLRENCKSFLAAEFDEALKALLRLKVIKEKKPGEFEINEGPQKSLSQMIKENILKDWIDRFKEQKLKVFKELATKYLSYLEFLHFLRVVARKEELQGDYYIVPKEEMRAFVDREDIKSLIEDFRVKGLVFEGFDREKEALFFPSFLISEIESWLSSLLAQASSLIFVGKGRELKAISILEELLRNDTREYVKIWDPYINSKVLVIVEAVPAPFKIQILTSQIEDESIFSRYLEQLTKSRQVEILKVERISDGAPPYHDRFILTMNKAWHVGTSLKDIGRKDTAITELRDEQKKIVEKAFDYYWLVKEGVLEERDQCRRQQFRPKP